VLGILLVQGESLDYDYLRRGAETLLLWISWTAPFER
jgi:hypothetical protein